MLLPLRLYELSEEVLLECRKEPGKPFLFSRELGDLYFQTGRFEQSLVEALNVLQSSPEEISFVMARIKALQKLLPGREALDLVEEYIDQRKGTTPFLKLLSTLYVHAGEMDRAFGSLRELAGQDPEAGTGELISFVRICEEREVFKEGVEACRLLAALDPTRKIIFDLDAAHLSRLSGSSGEARRILREILEANPDSLISSQIYFSLGEIALYDRNRPKEAVEWFRKIIDHGSGVDINFGARIAIMEALVYLGDYGEAAEVGNRVDLSGIHGDQEIEMMFFQGVALILAGRIEEGKNVLGRVSKKTGHLRANDAIEALTWLGKDTSTDFAVTRGLIELRSNSRIGDHNRSFKLLKSLRKNASKTPIAPDVIYYQARTYRAANRVEEAIIFFDEIVDSFPDHRLVHGDSIIAPKARKDLEEIARKQMDDR
jgi:tetratricopeptide (TPR) repeat protein